MSNLVSTTPRFCVINHSCIDVAEDHRAWLASQGVDMVADKAFQSMDMEALDRIAAGAHALFLPAAVHAFPTAAHMEKHESIRVLTIAASGFEWCDLEAATRCGIVVANAPGGMASDVVAEHAFGLMLAVARKIPHHHSQIQQGIRERHMGIALAGKTLGIVGLGHIGKAAATRARGFDMRVLATARTPDEEFNQKHGVDIVPLETLLRESDFVSLHLRLAEGTENLIGARELALMKPSAVIINTARRRLVDEPALFAALAEGRLGGAGLDDPPGERDERVLSMPNVVFTPHLGNRAAEGIHAAFRVAAENALAVLAGERPSGLLNPAVYDSPALRTKL